MLTWIFIHSSLISPSTNGYWISSIHTSLKAKDIAVKAKSLLSLDNKEGEKNNTIYSYTIESLEEIHSEWQYREMSVSGRGQESDRIRRKCPHLGGIIWTDVQIMTGGVDVKKHILSLQNGKYKNAWGWNEHSTCEE